MMRFLKSVFVVAPFAVSVAVRVVARVGILKFRLALWCLPIYTSSPTFTGRTKPFAFFVFVVVVVFASVAVLLVSAEP